MKTTLPFTPTLFPNASAHLFTAGERMKPWLRFPFQAMVSFPGSLRSFKVCMLMTSSVFIMTGGWGLCLSRRWHLRATLSSSIMALQKDLCRRKYKNQKRMGFRSLPLSKCNDHPKPPVKLKSENDQMHSLADCK